MKTKYLVRFLNRVAHYDADLELSDIFDAAVRSGKLASAEVLFDGVDSKKHPRLYARKVSPHNRNLACGHLGNTLRAAFIKDIYEDFSTYITDLIRGCAQTGLQPNRLIGEHKFQVDANQLLLCGSWDGVLTYVSEHLFRRLEGERSTIKLVAAIDSKLGLKLEAKICERALLPLDLRHLFVHRDGIADTEFCQAHPSFGLKPGEAVALTYRLICEARESIVALAIHMDERAVTLGLMPKLALQP